MILLCGVPSDTPLTRVREQLRALDQPFVFFNQRRCEDAQIDFTVQGDRVRGVLEIDGRRHRLEDIGGVYTRLLDDRVLPELADEAEGSARRRHCRALHEALARWCEIAPARVVNRSRPMGSNCSKPYQAQLIREHGFRVPPTLISNDPGAVGAFAARHGRVIYKSLSGVRSIVHTLEAADAARLERIRWCPTQFQAYVEGTNIRVHVIGDVLFATAIETDATDYRYAHAHGGSTQLTAIELSPALRDRCVALARALGLAFAGIDLKRTDEGEIYCFEVNPSPAFSYYEAHTGQPIARAVARYLAAAAPP